jgi:hypothetical protein
MIRLFGNEEWIHFKTPETLKLYVFVLRESESDDEVEDGEGVERWW